jgi:sugar lactone lactonase YvrE
MPSSGRITAIKPGYAIAGAEIIIECEGFSAGSMDGRLCRIGGSAAHLTAASNRRMIAIVPDGISGSVTVELEAEGREFDVGSIVVGTMLVGEMHIVANPAVDPEDDSILITRSGSRGQSTGYSLYRFEPDGFVDELPAEVLNPTGIAFSPSGWLYVSNRADGEVYRIDRSGDVLPYATGLGIATGIAFGPDGLLYVGDRSGTIYRIPEFGIIERFATLEPSVSAYHLAFGPDGWLYVSAPGLASHESICRIDAEGKSEPYVRGFGRPQGLAFDSEGNLFAAACYAGRRGIFRIDAATKDIELFAAGNGIVGLCFTRKQEMIAASGYAIYSIAANIKGTLLDQ